MSAYLYISPSFRSPGKYCYIDIKCINNIDLPNGHKYPSEKHEVDCPHFPILIQRGEGKFECLDDASYWAKITKQYQATHLRCFVVDDSKHSEVETQELKILCEFYIPATRCSASCEKFIEEYYTNPYFKGLMQRFFFSGSSLTEEDLFSLLGAWGKKLRTLQRRKDKYDAVTHRKKEAESPDVASQKQPLSANINKALQESSEQTNSGVSDPSNPPAPLNNATEDKETSAIDRAIDTPIHDQHHSSLKNVGKAVEPSQRSDEHTNKKTDKATVELQSTTTSLNAPSNKEVWNQFALTKDALCYEEVIKLLKSEENIKKFDALISDNQLDQALQRLNEYIELIRSRHEK